MSYIFMDESGCLGFDFTKKLTSKYFIITFLFVHNKRALDKIVRKTFLALSAREQKTHSGVFHCNKEKSKTRRRLLESLCNLDDISVMSIRLNKAKVYAHLHEEKAKLYNYTTNMLIDRVVSRKLVPLDIPITFIASQRETNKYLNEDFRKYLSTQQKKRNLNEFHIQIKSPKQEKGLQAVDFLTWSIFRNYEHGDDSYMSIFKDILVENSPLYSKC